MSYPHRIEPPQIERQPNALRVEVMDPQPRCRLRPLTDAARFEVEHRPFHVNLSWASFGICQGGARSCDECPRAKTDPYAEQAIAEGDTVRTTKDDLFIVERFETKRGFLTGYVFLHTERGVERFKISEITLHRKKEDYRIVS